jgi:hypothetical protein
VKSAYTTNSTGKEVTSSAEPERYFSHLSPYPTHIHFTAPSTVFPTLLNIQPIQPPPETVNSPFKVHFLVPFKWGTLHCLLCMNCGHRFVTLLWRCRKVRISLTLVTHLTSIQYHPETEPILSLNSHKNLTTSVLSVSAHWTDSVNAPTLSYTEIPVILHILPYSYRKKKGGEINLSLSLSTTPWRWDDMVCGKISTFLRNLLSPSSGWHDWWCGNRVCVCIWTWSARGWQSLPVLLAVGRECKELLSTGHHRYWSTNVKPSFCQLGYKLEWQWLKEWGSLLHEPLQLETAWQSEQSLLIRKCY